MSLSPLEYLQHILDETEYLISQAQGLSGDEFMQDETLKRAFVRSIEIIGEATKQVPEDIRQKYTHIQWRAMAGMRDRLIHSYFGVDYDIVWDVVINKIPGLRQEIEEILRNENFG
jgi:uncharacterized protein with HEPN domain